MTPDPTLPPSEHARLQAAVDALCKQLPDTNLDAAVELAQQERQPG